LIFSFAPIAYSLQFISAIRLYDVLSDIVRRKKRAITRMEYRDSIYLIEPGERNRPNQDSALLEASPDEEISLSLSDRMK